MTIPRAVGLIPVLLLTGCGASVSATPTVPAAPTTPPAPTTFVVQGTVTVKADQEPVEDENSTCPQTTYSDVQAGTSIIMTDASGTTVGLGMLQSPRIDKVHEVKGAWFPYPSNCIYDFTVSDVPIGSAFFGFEVGQRGVVQLPAASAKAPELTLG